MKVNVPEINLPRVVVIGGGFGGINLAQSLKDQPVQVVMFDKNNYHTFQPLLYQVATGGLEPDSIAFPIRKLFKRYENFHFRMAEVQRIDPESRTVFTSIGTIGYDYLVIATGSRTNFFGNAQIEQHCLGMKDIPEALDLRSLILQNFESALMTPDLEEREALMNFVVVGAGPTGVETAGSLGELKNHILPKDYPELDIRRMNIHLVEAGDAVLASMSPEAQENAAKALKKLDVNVWLDTRVDSYDGKEVKTSTGKTIGSATVIWTAGIIGNGVEGVHEATGWGGRLKVNEFSQVEGYENVFAIGDVSLMKTEAYPDGHPQVAQPAIQQGKLLARNILSTIFGRPKKPFAYYDKGSMATIGRNKAVVDIKNIRLSGSIAWLAWMVVHLVFLAGFRNKLVVFINWFWSYVTYDKGTRLIIRPFKRRKPKEIPNEKVLEPAGLN